jgi:hypothetical protein
VETAFEADNRNNWTEFNSQETAKCRIFQVREGFELFDSAGPAAGWLENLKRSDQFVYNSTGLAIGWSKTEDTDDGAISVYVYQVLINGRRPAGILGGNDSKIIEEQL